MPPLSRRFDFRGDAVAWDCLGAGEPVVLVHGTPFSSHVWRDVARELAWHRKVYLFDLLGYGQSAKREGQDVSLGVQNVLFAALLREWGLERPDVIAHDFGGATALRAHLLDGCDYRRLLLVDPVTLRPWGSPFVQHVRAHEAAFAGVPAYLQEAILQAYIRTAAHRPPGDDELEPYVAPWTGPEGQPAFYRQIAQMDLRFTDEIEPRLGALRCPPMLLWGREDGWLPVENGRRLAALLPDCTLREIPDCGHLVQEDAPEAVVAAALSFLG